MTDAYILAEVFSADELSTLKTACIDQVMAGAANQGFVVSSAVGGRSVTLQKEYSAWDMLNLLVTALEYKAGRIASTRTTRAAYGVY